MLYFNLIYNKHNCLLLVEVLTFLNCPACTTIEIALTSQPKREFNLLGMLSLLIGTTCLEGVNTKLLFKIRITILKVCQLACDLCSSLYSTQ